MEESYKTEYKSDSSEGGSQEPPKSENIQITLSKEKLMNGFVALQFVLLLVIGWQLVDIKKELRGDAPAAKGDKVAALAAPTPVPAAAAGGVANIEIGENENIKGPADAKVTIVEYSDFECPFCGRVTPTIAQIVDEYGDDVRIVYRHFPLNSIHPYAQKAAEASECAADQGKFWQFHDLIFADQAGLKGGDDQLKAWAAELGLNAGTFAACLDSGEKKARVTSDQSGGTTLGVTGTPGFFVNGINLSGAQPFSAFKTLIDQELTS